jgi:hypothetical protein
MVGTDPISHLESRQRTGEIAIGRALVDSVSQAAESTPQPDGAKP